MLILDNDDEEDQSSPWLCKKRVLVRRNTFQVNYYRIHMNFYWYFILPV